jgi:hypothetical protein
MAWVMFLVLQGCLYSTHHFHNGQVMNAGHSQATFGVGRQPVWNCHRDAGDSANTKLACADGTERAKNAGETVQHTTWPKGSFHYRLGLRDNWGPFPAIEMEWHFEVPTNPATMEFGLNFALPGPSFMHHKLGGGWGVGAWADDSFFAEYAISLISGQHLLFTNFRATWLATQIGDVLGEDFAKPFPRNQHFVFQTAYGLFYRLPDWPVVPDFIIPSLNLTLPSVPAGEQKFKPSDIPTLQWDINVGLGWGF